MAAKASPASDIHAASSSRLSDEEVRVFCDEVRRIRKDGCLDLITAENVYDAALAYPKKYPAIHARLTRLDVNEAARRWGLKEAGMVLAAVRTYSVVSVSTGERSSVREYVHVAGSDNEEVEYVGPGYCPRKEMLGSKARREVYVSRQKADLRNWCARNVDIEELSPLRAAISKLIRE